MVCTFSYVSDLFGVRKTPTSTVFDGTGVNTNVNSRLVRLLCSASIYQLSLGSQHRGEAGGGVRSPSC